MGHVTMAPRRGQQHVNDVMRGAQRRRRHLTIVRHRRSIVWSQPPKATALSKDTSCVNDNNVRATQTTVNRTRKAN